MRRSTPLHSKLLSFSMSVARPGRPRLRASRTLALLSRVWRTRGGRSSTSWQSGCATCLEGVCKGQSGRLSGMWDAGSGAALTENPEGGPDCRPACCSARPAAPAADAAHWRAAACLVLQDTHTSGRGHPAAPPVPPPSGGALAAGSRRQAQRRAAAAQRSAPLNTPGRQTSPLPTGRVQLAFLPISSPPELVRVQASKPTAVSC